MRELNLLQHVYQANSSLPDNVAIPPGDDMGAVRIGDATVLVTVDQLADGVHIDLAQHSLEQTARKAITRNLSDVAAMAAQPTGAVVAVALPRDFGEQRATDLFDAMRAVAERYHCPLVGGDLSMWDHPLLITVTIMAETAGIEPVLRRGAQPGDVIFVTGQLGGSIETVNGYTHHIDFEPRLQIARTLAGDPATRPRCMLDLSDGLGQDLPRLCRLGVSSSADNHPQMLTAILDAAALPVSPGAKHSAERDGQPDWRHALADGEDYELCLLVPAERAHAMPANVDGVTVTRVGVIGEPADDIERLLQVRLPDGQLVEANDLGWEHGRR